MFAVIRNGPAKENNVREKIETVASAFEPALDA